MLHPDFLARPIAHRALHDIAAGRPENSVSAIRAAVDAGYGIEIDLQLSKDGQAIVFHDYDLARLTHETGPLATRTAAELTAIQLRHGSETIPTLETVLSIIDGRVPLLIEIKDQSGILGPTNGALEQATADCMAGYNGPVAVMSFNPHSVARMAELSPTVPRGLTTCNFDAGDWPTIPARIRDTLRDIPDYARTGACFISHQHDQLNAPRVADLRKDGAHILCWTIRTPDAERKAREIADNITFEGYAA